MRELGAVLVGSPAYHSACLANSSSVFTISIGGQQFQFDCNSNTTVLPFLDTQPCSVPPPTLERHTHECRAGPAAATFVKVDADGDFRLTMAEAKNAARVMDAHERIASRAACQIRTAFNSCFGHASGSDVILDRSEYSDIFMPCLTNGLPAECRDLLCNDFVT